MADGIELEVQMSMDEVPVVIHDEKIDRVAELGTGFVRDYALDELKDLNVGNADLDVPVAQIPTLDEVLELLEPTALTLEIELRTGVVHYPHMVDKVLELLKAHHMEERTILASCNRSTIAEIQEKAPAMKTALIFDQESDDTVAYAAAHQIPFVQPHLNFAGDASFRKKCAEKNLEVIFWPCLIESDIHIGVDQDAYAILVSDLDFARFVITRYYTQHNL